MKVALLTLTRGRVSGGYRKYLDRFVPLLRAQPDVERLDVFVPSVMAGPDVHTWPANDDLRGFPALRTSLRELKPDVLFVPTARLLRVDDIPVVTMVHNMEPLEVPFHGHRPREMARNLARAAVSWRATHFSDRVIAVSQHVRDFLVHRWNISPERIGVVSNGIDPAAADPLTVPPQLESIANGRFLFTAGSIRPARGLQDVIEALASVPEDVQLVIGGSVDRGVEHYAEKLRVLARRLRVDGRVLWAGQLGREAMSWCFRNADLFVMTSRAEACPNIVLEALTEGAASISTDHQPMPEFFGETSVYYPARNARLLATRLNETLAAPADVRLAMRQRARERALRYKWSDTAQATINEFRRALR